MTIGFQKAFGVGNTGGIRLGFPIPSSRTWVAPADGLVVARCMAGAGSGANAGTNATGAASGGYSASWALKVFRVLKGQSIPCVVGAGGAPVTVQGNGNAGNVSSITVAGVTHSVPAGPGGIYAAGAPVIPDGPVSADTWWDLRVASVKPGLPNTGSGAVTGGAGVDILAQGNNPTSSGSGTQTGGGGTGSSGTASNARGGGALPGGLDVFNNIPASGNGTIVVIGETDWGISFYGGSGGPGGEGGNGGGGAYASPSGFKGGPGGGGGSAIGANAMGGDGGLGGGGGAVRSSSGAFTSGRGGAGWIFFEFFQDISGV